MPTDEKQCHCIYCGRKLTAIQVKRGYDKCDNCTDRLERGMDMYP